MMMSNRGPIQMKDTILGSDFLAIQSAWKVFERRQPDLSHYRILIVDDGDCLSVIFMPTTTQMAAHESFAVRQGSDAAMDLHERNALLLKLEHAKILATIDGRSFQAMQVASKVFERHQSDLTQYNIQVVCEGEAVVVIFTDKAREPGIRGGGNGRPGFEVELNGADFAVLRANFIR